MQLGIDSIVFVLAEMCVCVCVYLPFVCFLFCVRRSPNECHGEILH